MEQPRLLTTAQLADELLRDVVAVAVAELYRPTQDLTRTIAELVASEHVPYLAALRYADTGLVTRAVWENVWALQRIEDPYLARVEELREEKKSAEAIARDAGADAAAKAAAEATLIRLKHELPGAEEVHRPYREAIPLPPKYAPADFRRPSFWRQRGKLDVPKERFISYPEASRDGDPHLLLGWAGWDHREQAQALAMLITEREQTDGWGAQWLTPLLAGLRELLPWVYQWHGEFDPDLRRQPRRGVRLHSSPTTPTASSSPTTPSPPGAPPRRPEDAARRRPRPPETRYRSSWPPHCRAAVAARRRAAALRGNLRPPPATCLLRSRGKSAICVA
ncbi:hypothetical protein FF36_03552 [Frankia torreyi]|uniref:DUF7008 domain-containing protein n=1 Tax=Frankia torreyi TaxID=1856 RepID=A0A0D8BDH4_9ACTN|nr:MULTISPECIES: hypothetical protein [Frankia]KJE22120.1 hypothetical protein FF36_03552 [Frankia torreyi]